MLVPRYTELSLHALSGLDGPHSCVVALCFAVVPLAACADVTGVMPPMPVEVHRQKHEDGQEAKLELNMCAGCAEEYIGSFYCIWLSGTHSEKRIGNPSPLGMPRHNRPLLKRATREKAAVYSLYT